MKNPNQSNTSQPNQITLEARIDEIAKGDPVLKAALLEKFKDFKYQPDNNPNHSAQNEYKALPFWSIHGRMRRRTYALCFIPTLVVWLMIQMGVKGAASGLKTTEITFGNLFTLNLMAFIPIIFMIFIGIKRLHDCDYKGWWLLIPFVNIAILFVRGTEGNNRFGIDPRPENNHLNDDDGHTNDYSFWGVLTIALLIVVAQVRIALIEHEWAQKSIEKNTRLQQSVTPKTTAHHSRPSNTATITQPVQALPEPITSTADVTYGGLLGRILSLSLNAHVRDCPSKQCKSFGVIPLGSQVIVVQNPMDGQFANGDWLYINYEGHFCHQYDDKKHVCRNHAQARVAGWLHMGALKGNYGIPQTERTASTNATSFSLMMQYYLQPETAPATAECRGDILCNAFVALAKQWQAIPHSYRYEGFDIRQQAAEGDGHGLYKGFILSTNRAIELSEAAAVFYSSGGTSNAQERLFAQGLAVLLYLEDQNGWAK